MPVFVGLRGSHVLSKGEFPDAFPISVASMWKQVSPKQEPCGEVLLYLLITHHFGCMETPVARGRREAIDGYWNYHHLRPPRLLNPQRRLIKPPPPPQKPPAPPSDTISSSSYGEKTAFLFIHFVHELLLGLA